MKYIIRSDKIKETVNEIQKVVNGQNYSFNFFMHDCMWGLYGDEVSAIEDEIIKRITNGLKAQGIDGKKIGCIGFYDLYAFYPTSLTNVEKEKIIKKARILLLR